MISWFTNPAEVTEKLRQKKNWNLIFIFFFRPHGWNIFLMAIFFFFFLQPTDRFLGAFFFVNHDIKEWLPNLIIYMYLLLFMGTCNVLEHPEHTFIIKVTTYLYIFQENIVPIMAHTIWWLCYLVMITSLGVLNSCKCVIIADNLPTQNVKCHFGEIHTCCKPTKFMFIMYLVI